MTPWQTLLLTQRLGMIHRDRRIPRVLLSDFGWIIEPTDSGGVRMRTSGIVRRFVLGCSFGLLLLFSFFALVRVLLSLGDVDDPEEDTSAESCCVDQLGVRGVVGCYHGDPAAYSVAAVRARGVGSGQELSRNPPPITGISLGQQVPEWGVDSGAQLQVGPPEHA